MALPEASVPENVRKWRNWQTRKPQELMAARPWGFKSPLPHHASNGPVPQRTGLFISIKTLEWHATVSIEAGPSRARPFFLSPDALE